MNWAAAFAVRLICITIFASFAWSQNEMSGVDGSNAARDQERAFEFLKKNYPYVGVRSVEKGDGSSGGLRYFYNHKWNDLHEVNRTEFFKKALMVMPEFLSQLQISLPQEQLRILSNLNQYLKNIKPNLYFTYSPAYFELNPGETQRTGSTTSSRNDMIMINKLIINDPAVQLSFADAFQLILHEIGHKVEKSSQNDMDSLAAKIRSAFEEQLITKKEVGQFNLTILKHPFLILFENRLGVFDRTESLLAAIKPNQNLLEAYQPIIYESQKSIDKKLSVYSIDVYFGPLKKLILKIKSRYEEAFLDTDFYYRDVDASLRQSAIIFESHVLAVDNLGKPFKLLSSINPFSVDESITVPEIKYRWINDNQLEFSTQIPENLKESPADLLIENGKIYFRLKPQKIDEKGTVTWILGFDQISQENPIIAQSVVIKNNTLVFSKEGALIKIPAQVPSSRKTKLQLKSIQVKSDEPEKNVAGPSKTIFKFYFRSRAPIKEIRIAIGKTLNSYMDFNVQEPGILGGRYQDGYPLTNTSPASYQTQFDYLTFTENEFTQSRQGDFVEVIINREEYLKHSYIVTGRVTQKISWFYTFTHTGKKMIGLDKGSRRISHIEAVNASLEQISTKWQTSVNYRLYQKAFCADLLQNVESLKDSLKSE